MNFTIDQLRKVMDMKKNIRSMSVIAHVDHGKTTLSDCLVQRAGIIAERDAGTKMYMSRSQEEVDRCITIKASGISLYFK